MLKFFNADKKNYKASLQIILNKRKFSQLNKSNLVKKILSKVAKGGDKAVISYEKKFSKIKKNLNSIQFSNDEIKKVTKYREEMTVPPSHQRKRLKQLVI